MRKIGTLSTMAATCAGIVLVASPALAGTRAGDSKTTYQAAPATKGQADKQLKTDVGPANGFPDTPGLARARERANENAAFNRNKSNGAA